MKNKLEKWLERYVKAKRLGIVRSQRSTYYTLNSRILRISDHVAIHSDGDISIICDSHDEEHFLVHAVKTGEISVLTYKEVKTLIRGIALLPSVMYIANAKTVETVKCDAECNVENTAEEKTNAIKQAIKESAEKQLVLGVPIGRFKQGAQIIIHNMVKKLRSSQ